MGTMTVILQVLTDRGPVELGRFWDMEGCSFVLRLISGNGGTGWCLQGWAA